MGQVAIAAPPALAASLPAKGESVEVLTPGERATATGIAPATELENRHITSALVRGQADPSWSHLESVRDQVAELTGPLHGPVMVSVDVHAGKVELVVQRRDLKLEHELAARFGAAEVYVRVDPGLPQISTLVGTIPATAELAAPAALPRGTRQSDYHPWSGGARYRLKGATPLTPGLCTTGFPWIINKKKYMLTAGHCLPNGGWTWSNVSSELLGGVVQKDRDENWHISNGTQQIARLGGTDSNNGDLARIPVWTATSIYVGGPASTAIKQVSGANFTFERDRICSGGSYSGELCGWEVSRVATSVRYKDGQWARNVSVATRTDGRCTMAGDSGGPIYRPHSNNSVHAHGILSGGGRSGNTCSVIFTDIFRAVDLWGGQLHVKRFF